MKSQKGQTIFEFIIAAVILFSIIVYILGFVNGEISTFSGNFHSDKMESKVVSVSESLMNPYAKNNIVDKWPVLDHNKMINLNNYCNTSYINLLDDMELYELDPMGGTAYIHLVINAKDMETNANIIDCGRKPFDIVEKPDVFEVKRIGVDSTTNDTVELKIWIWDMVEFYNK